MEPPTVPQLPSPSQNGEKVPHFDRLRSRMRGGNSPYRFKLPRIPRTRARPSPLATERVTLFTAASITVSRW